LIADDSSETHLVKVALLLQYNGAFFHGAQSQGHQSPHLLTVQTALEQAFQRLHIPLMKPLRLAARTDAGVHALGQVAMLCLQVKDLERFRDLRHSLNAALPEGLSILRLAAPVEASFHVVHHAQWRWYRYLWLHQASEPVLRGPHGSWLPKTPYRPIDWQAMQEALNGFLGWHSFLSLQAPTTTHRSEFCTLRHLRLQEIEEGVWAFDVIGDRFLYKMVRILAGTLLAFGKQPHRFQATWATDLIQAKDRGLAGPTAPAQGLCLQAIAYEPCFQYFQDTRLVSMLETTLSTWS
jgi:tRNA pseudouridine38-40 synthase